MADCFDSSLPGLAAYRPKLLYHLVDEARLKLHPLPEIRNLAEALFCVEQSRTAKNMFDIMRALDKVLREPQMAPLRRTIGVWFKLMLRRKVPQANIQELDAIDDVLKESTMLEQTIERWFDDATWKGMQQGIQQGKQEGFAELVALQLNLRFNGIPDWVQEQLNAASQEQLVKWAGAILTAKSLNDFFGSSDPIH